MGQRFEIPPLVQIAQQMTETMSEIVKAENLLKISESNLTDYLRNVNRISSVTSVRGE